MKAGPRQRKVQRTPYGVFIIGSRRGYIVQSSLGSNCTRRTDDVRASFVAGLAASILATTPLEAAGCLKGAAVGGIAGHYVGRGHAVLGAAAGCIYGHHLANKALRARKSQQTARR